MICKLPRENRLSVTQQEEEHDEESAGKKYSTNMQHIRANWLRIWLSTNLPAEANYTRKTSKLAMKKQFACTFISTPWHCAKWQANAAKTVARCRTFWATGQAHKCHTRRMLNVHCAQNFGQNIPTKNELYFKWSQLKPIKFFSPAWLVQLFCQFDSAPQKATTTVGKNELNFLFRPNASQLKFRSAVTNN